MADLFMDQESLPSSNPTLEGLNKIFLRQESDEAKKKVFYEQLLERIKMEKPDWSPLAQHFHASSLLRQSQLQDYTAERGYKLYNQQLKQTY